MKTNQAAKFAAMILAIAGLSAMVGAGLVATRSFPVTVPVAPSGTRQFNCGSVLFPKDPRNKVSARVKLPLAFQRAYNRCQKKSSDRIHTATTFLLVGVVPLLIVLTLPALSRRSRRSRARRRTRL